VIENLSIKVLISPMNDIPIKFPAKALTMTINHFLQFNAKTTALLRSGTCAADPGPCGIANTLVVIIVGLAVGCLWSYQSFKPRYCRSLSDPRRSFDGE